GEVELLVAVDPRELGRLAPDQHAARRAAYLRRALDELGDLLWVDARRRRVVEEEERPRAGRQDVVDAVRGEVGAAVVQASALAREHELRADAVGGRGEEAP